MDIPDLQSKVVFSHASCRAPSVWQDAFGHWPFATVKTTGARFEDQPLVPKPSLGWCCLTK